ncbi:MAG: cytochrome c oxidase subunit 3 [Planctomycetes bacterium]|nr:cytochrome c oxidase subunit 3 [Planctomycetota bacterium]
MSQTHAAAGHDAHGHNDHGHDDHGHGMPALPDAGFGTATNGKIAMWMFLVTDGLTFAGLLLGYGYLRIKNTDWPNPQDVLGIALTGIATFLLICSSVAMVMSLAAASENNRSGMLRWLFLTALGGMAFLGIQAYEYNHNIHEGIKLWGMVKPEHLEAGEKWKFAGVPDNFASTFYLVTGFHGMHVTTGVIYLLVMFFKGLGQKKITPQYYNLLEIAGLFWHFVDLVWILVFTFIYLI